MPQQENSCSVYRTSPYVELACCLHCNSSYCIAVPSRNSGCSHCSSYFVLPTTVVPAVTIAVRSRCCIALRFVPSFSWNSSPACCCSRCCLCFGLSPSLSLVTSGELLLSAACFFFRFAPTVVWPALATEGFLAGAASASISFLHDQAAMHRVQDTPIRHINTICLASIAMIKAKHVRGVAYA